MPGCASSGASLKVRQSDPFINRPVRDLITLVEQLTRHRWVTKADIERVLDGEVGIEHGSDFLRTDLATHGMDQMLEWANSLPASYGAMVPVYRGLHADPDAIDWTNIGVSWSPDFRHAINEHGEDGGFGRPQDDFTNVVLYGEVAHDDVDWLLTFCIAIEDGQEPEIRLKKGVNVRIKQIMTLDQSAHDAGRDLTVDDADIDSVSITATT